MSVLYIRNKQTGQFTPIRTIRGEDGKDGTDGKTPVKGEDYWTAADRQQMINDVIAALPVYNGEVVT